MRSLLCLVSVVAAATGAGRNFLATPQDATVGVETQFSFEEEQRATRQLKKACKHLDEGEADQALERLHALDIPLAPIRDSIWARRARALMALDRFDEAKNIWQAILSQYPRGFYRAEALFGAARAQWELGDEADATKSYRTALRAFPEHHEADSARLRIGRGQASRGDIASARLMWALAARARDPDIRAEATSLLSPQSAPGVEHAEEFAASLREIDRLLSARSLERAQAAIDVLEPQAANMRQSDLLCLRRGQLALRNDDFSAGQGIIERLVKRAVGERRHVLERELARALTRGGRIDEAISVLEMAARRAPSKKAAAALELRAATTAFEGKRWSVAQARLLRWRARNPHAPEAAEATFYAALAAFHAQNWQQAESGFRELGGHSLETYSAQSAQAAYWLARTELHLGKSDLAQSRLGALRGSSGGYYGLLAHSALSAQNKANCRLSVAPTRTPEQPTSASPALHWQSEAGARVRLFMQSGLIHEARHEVENLSDREGAPHNEGALARGHLYAQLGDFANASSLASRTFGAELKRPLSLETAPYFALGFPQAHDQIVFQAAETHQVSPLLIFAVMRQESAFRTQALSGASAHGLMQIIPVTAHRIAQARNLTPPSDAELTRPEINIDLAAWYLAQLLQQFDGNVALAAASYNAGPQAVFSWLEREPNQSTDLFVEDIPFRETRNYVKNVLRNLAVYEQLYGDRRIALTPYARATTRVYIDF